LHAAELHALAHAAASRLQEPAWPLAEPMGAPLELADAPLAWQPLEPA
jgi:hypothetical protein